MPELAPVPNVLKMQFHHTVGGQNAWVHWHFRFTGSGPASTDCSAIANSMKAAWITNFEPLCNGQTILVAVLVTDLTSDTAGQGSSSGTSTGTRAGTLIPGSASVLINLHTARRWRGGHYRQYWPFGVATDVYGTTQWSAALQNAVAPAYNAMVAAANAITWAGGSGLNPVGVSYFKSSTAVTNERTGRVAMVSTPRPTPVVDPITSSSVNPNIAQQRRRLLFA